MRQRMAAPSTVLTTVVLITLGASSVHASVAVADLSVGGADVLARVQALVKPLEPAVVRDLELAAPFPQPMSELAPAPAVEEHPLVETIKSIPQAGLPNAEDSIMVFDEVEDSVERSMRVLELPAFRSAGKRSALQTPSGRAAMFGASSVNDSVAVANAHVPGSNDLDLARLQALVKQLEPAVVKDHGGGQRSRRRSKKELAAPQPVPAEEPAHIETIQSIPQAGFPNADDVIIVFDEVEASVERALRHLTSLGASPVPSPGAASLRDNGSEEVGSGEVGMACSLCANRYAGGVCLVPLAFSECPDEPWTYANCSGPTAVGDFCEADGEELSTDPYLDNCNGDFDLYKRVECIMPCSSCPNSNAGGVCLVPIVHTMCPDDPWTYANCSAPMTVGHFCEADDGELSTDPMLDNCNGDFDVYKRIECNETPMPPPLPLAPGSTLRTVTGTQVVVTFKVAGDVSDFDQDTLDDIKARLEAHFSCYRPECYATLRVTPASVNLELELISTAPDTAALIATTEDVRVGSLESLSELLGATVEEAPEVAVTEGVTVVVTLAAPSPPPPLPPPPLPLPPVASPAAPRVSDDESEISNMASLGWTAWMGIGGGAFLCLCLGTLWVSNLCVARRKRLESGGRLHANIFGVPTRHPWGLSKSDTGWRVELPGMSTPGVGAGEVAVTLAGESSEQGGRVSGVGGSPGRETTEEIALHLEADPDRELAASHASPAKSRASPDREELIPMGIVLPKPGDGSSPPPRSKLERLRGSFYSKSCDIEGGGAASGPSASFEPGSGGEAGAQSALERAVQARVRSRSRLTDSAPRWIYLPSWARHSSSATPAFWGWRCWLWGALRTLQERPCGPGTAQGPHERLRHGHGHTRLGHSCGLMPRICTSRRQASINRSRNLDLSGDGPTVGTDGGGAARTPALNLLRSFLNEVSDGADSVARRMSVGGGRRREGEGSDDAPSTWRQKRKPSAPSAADKTTPAVSAPSAPPGASSSSGDALRSALPQWNGSSANSLADEGYSSNYPAGVDAEAKGGDTPLAFQKWRTQMRAEGYDDSELTKEAHHIATRPGSVGRDLAGEAWAATHAHWAATQASQPTPPEERPIVHI